MRALVLSTTLAMLAMTGGCLELLSGGPPASPPCSFGYVNFTDKELTNVGLAGGYDQGNVGRFLTPRSFKISSPAPGPLPARGTFTWRTPDGVLHTQAVEIATKVPDPQRFDGSIYLEIRDAGASVAVVPKGHELEYQLP